MIDKLIELGDGRLLIPLVIVVTGAAFAKGVFTLFRSRSQDRRDFLDLFRGHGAQSDLWVTVAVRHVFGAYLPTSLIRQLMSSPQPGRALLEVASAWSFIDMDDETNELSWRIKAFRSARLRKLCIAVLALLYFVLAFVSLSLVYVCLSGDVEGKVLRIGWTYAVLTGVGAFAALSYGDNLKDAHVAVSRWLGLA